uniref:Uncharacterized protein n=1 Tax=Romanomermis culicivorax TaxID=13658 RepID=A0A915HK67_ROMCU
MRFRILFPFMTVCFLDSVQDISTHDKIQGKVDDSDRFWIFIENVNVMECEGPSNQFQLSPNHISVRNRKGQSVEYIEVPGEYALAFDNIRVENYLPNLSGDLAITLQMPLIQSNLAYFNVPYQIVPQKKVFFNGHYCDDESGVVTDPIDGIPSCRYCDLCRTSSKVEHELSSKLRLDRGESFDKVCHKIGPDTYSIWRTISLPGRKDLEKEIQEKYRTKIGADTLQRLKTGRGKFVVKLSAYTNPVKAFSVDAFFELTPGCECCSKRLRNSCIINVFNLEELTRGQTARCERCMNDYARQCVPGADSHYRAACYVIEFNFRMTDKRSDLDEFVRQLEANRHFYNNRTMTYYSANHGNVQSDYGKYLRQFEITTTTSSYDQPAADCDNLDERCLAKMSDSSRIFCSRYLKSKGPAKKFCCKLCNAK